MNDYIESFIAAMPHMTEIDIKEYDELLQISMFLDPTKDQELIAEMKTKRLQILKGQNHEGV